MTISKEIAAYVRNNVEFFEERLQLALNRIDRLRCPLSMADSQLYYDICNAIEDWCLDNEVDEDTLDLEAVENEIIWEK